MADLIETHEWDQMKAWTQAIYNKTKGSTPTISNITAGSIILASQAKELQNLLTTAYNSYVAVGCSSHNSTVKTSDHSTYDTYAAGNSGKNSSVKSTDYSSNRSSNKSSNHSSNYMSGEAGENDK